MEQLYKVLVSVLYADKAYGKTNAINMWTDCSPFGASISKCCGFVVSVSHEHTTWDTTPFPGPHTADPKFFALFCYSYSMCSGLKHVKFNSDIGSKCTNHYNTILCTYAHEMASYKTDHKSVTTTNARVTPQYSPRSGSLARTSISCR